MPKSFPDFVEFDCPVSKRCGGCQLTQLSYAQQLKVKQRHVEQCLAPFAQVEPIRGMSYPLHYRNKTHAVFAADKRGEAISGVYQQGTHFVVPVSQCLIENQRADEIICAIRRMLKSFKIRPYNEYTRHGLLRHVMIRTAYRTGEVMVVLVTASPVFPSKRHFVDALLAEYPEITTVVQNVNDRATSMVLGKRDIILYGTGYIEDILCGKRFRISPQSFYQVNSAQTEVLYRLAGEFAGLTGKETVLDAYCGIGTIGMTVAGQCAQVVGVELNPQAVKDAKENAKRNDIQNIRFFCADAGAFLVAEAQSGNAFDVVLMDPPRSGSDEAFLSSLIATKPEKIVYVSCSPDTLGRDVSYLQQGGYALRRAVPVDMFPYTEHVETVVLMSRVKGE